MRFYRPFHREIWIFFDDCLRNSKRINSYFYCLFSLFFLFKLLSIGLDHNGLILSWSLRLPHFSLRFLWLLKFYESFLKSCNIKDVIFFIFDSFRSNHLCGSGCTKLFRQTFFHKIYIKIVFYLLWNWACFAMYNILFFLFFSGCIIFNSFSWYNFFDDHIMFLLFSYCFLFLTIHFFNL